MNKQCGVCGERDCCGALTATVLSPLLDAKDAEIERLRGDLHKLKDDLDDVVTAEYWQQSRKLWKEVADYQERRRARMPEELAYRVKVLSCGVQPSMTQAEVLAVPGRMLQLLRDILAWHEQQERSRDPE